MYWEEKEIERLENAANSYSSYDDESEESRKVIWEEISRLRESLKVKRRAERSEAFGSFMKFLIKTIIIILAAAVLGWFLYYLLTGQDLLDDLR